MGDQLEHYGKGTIIQHGKLNNRIYLIKLQNEDIPSVIDYCNDLALKKRYSKIFCKVPCWASPLFLSKGYFVEAHIPQFYNHAEDVFFMSKIMNSDRYLNLELDKMAELSEMMKKTAASSIIKEPDKEYSLISLNEKHAFEMASVYKDVFKSYPFPIFDPDYIIETMKSHVDYFGILHNKRIIALSSAEKDVKGSNAEMTDFATLPDYRGKGLAIHLLKFMEKIMKKQKIYSLYTIARLNSLAMNKTFLRLNYKYAGILVKNTNISGTIESMVVYYKQLK